MTALLEIAQLKLRRSYEWHFLCYQHFRLLKLVLKRIWIIPISSKPDKHYSSAMGSFREPYV